jgi:hypothetical protein
VKIRSRFLIRSAARCVAAASRLHFRTMRLEVRAVDPRTIAYDYVGHEKYLYCLWHDAVLGVIFSRRARNMAGLVSRHADGSLLADAMQAVGVVPIRGSSRRGGAAALRQMMEAAAEYHIAIATDGPQGPRHVVKEGLVYLASQTGRPIVPAAFSAQSAWRPRGRWTDMVVPRPFSRTYIVVGAPINVPPGLSREELEPYRQQVQRGMDEVTHEAEGQARGERGELRAASGTDQEQRHAA